MNSSDRQSIEHFVRNTLGCQCPDEVFRSISIERVPASRDTLPRTRLVIGERLLIDVVETQTPKTTTAAVLKLTTQGRSDRDAKHYNRYRLVIASDHPTQLLAEAKTSFEKAAGDDPRAHLHILATDQLPGPIRPDMRVMESSASQAARATC